MTIKIGKWTFATKAAAVQHCQGILYSGDLDTEIVGDQAEFVRSIFQMRPDKVALLEGRSIRKFLRKKHRHNTPCFFAELSDGTLLDFSFMKVIK